ncbi:hypothetical protein [Plastoroseomonas hellenica]|uniref:hypothetical protein n=1 Tax=Plastoroseomonas hellenica TaxID=2687306 RepID=UPI001BA8C0FA|nr:hypothetical protein [Plastoroseomonas hellenica]MBR0647185.1 hypothetical protein [Plastoroseomonas hellenica]
MQPVPTRRPLMLLAAGWILAALPAAAQTPTPGIKTPAPPPVGTRRARVAAERGDVRDHIEAARAAIAARRPGAANDALERAETMLLNLRMARAGEDRSAPGGRAVVALKQAREALAARDFAAADAALRPLSDRAEWRS